MRTFAIGDIHGCLDALSAILQHIGLEDSDRVVFLGDYVDRGPDSYGVMEVVRKLHASGRAICLRGNHEEMMVSAQEGGNDLTFWLQVGGAAALASYQTHTGQAKVTDAHLRFVVDDCVDYFEDDTHLFVHGTAAPDLPLAEQDVGCMRWRRFGDPPPHISGKTLVTGHTSQKSGLPRDLGHAICIDTFCYGGQWLTCLETKTGTIVQANQHGELRLGTRAGRRAS